MPGATPFRLRPLFAYHLELVKLISGSSCQLGSLTLATAFSIREKSLQQFIPREPVVCCDVGDNGGKSADLERIVSGDRDVVFAGWSVTVSLRWLPVWRVIW